MSSISFAIIPGGYLLRSRLRGHLTILSWLLINPLLIGTVSYWVSDLTFGVFMIAFLLAFMAWQSVYEIGYLENDIWTVRRETQPTKRLAVSIQQLLEQKYTAVIIAKWGVGVLLVVTLALLELTVLPTIHVALFVVCLLATRLAFRLHNTFRSRANIVTYFALSSLKYVTLPLFFAVDVSPAILIAVMVLLFPVVRTLEHACKAKYEFPRLAGLLPDFDAFRPIYYFFLLIIFFAGTLLCGCSVLIVGVTASLYLLLIRSAAFGVSRRVARDKPTAYQWSRNE